MAGRSIEKSRTFTAAPTNVHTYDASEKIILACANFV